MYDRLQKIDDLTRPDHTFLEAEDDCFYMGEYTARGGFGASETNQLIFNLKKGMERRAVQMEWRHKVGAVETIAQDLRQIIGLNGFHTVTFVPIPPSKIKTDPDYDPRLMQILQIAGKGFDSDIRELVQQRESMDASHQSNVRAEIYELIQNYYIDEGATEPPPREHLIIFDDLLTTGRHYKAMQAVISERFPNAHLYGMFVARRIPNTEVLF